MERPQEKDYFQFRGNHKIIDYGSADNYIDSLEEYIDYLEEKLRGPEPVELTVEWLLEQRFVEEDDSLHEIKAGESCVNREKLKKDK